MAEEKKVYLKRDDKDGWMYVCPHCLKRIVIQHAMKKCFYCNEPINVHSCAMYKGKVKR